MATIIYYIPHQDDEIVTFGVSIVHHLMEGNDVHLVFYTDGTSSNTLRYFNGADVCRWHQVNHNYHFDEQKFMAARNREMKWSSLCLGVKPENLHWRQVVKDGSFTQEQGIQLIKEFEEKYPGALHMGFTYTDPHPDHAIMGRALLDMHKQKKIAHARYYIKTLFQDEVEGIEEPCYDEYLPFLHAAQQAYKIFKPEAGMFAIGYHSVKDTFDKQYKKPRSKYHLA